MLSTFEPFDFDDNGVLEPGQERRARNAIRACQDCPFLAECRADTEKVLSGTCTSNNFPPEAVVQAGILFGPDSERYEPPTAPTEEGMLPLDVHFADAVNASSDWQPPQAERRINWGAVRAALSDEGTERTVTIHYLVHQRIKPSEDYRLVLSAAEELAVIHHGLELGMSIWKLSVLLRTRWDRVDRLRSVHRLDTDNPNLDVADPKPLPPRPAKSAASATDKKKARSPKKKRAKKAA